MSLGTKSIHGQYECFGSGVGFQSQNDKPRKYSSTGIDAALGVVAVAYQGEPTVWTQFQFGGEMLAPQQPEKRER